MNKIKVAKSIALFSIAVGFMVMIGWFFDVTLLTSILPQWIRMKFATALCFVFSGFVIYFLAEKKEERKDIKTFVLTVFPMLLVLIMGTLFLGSVAGFETGMENLNFVDIHEVKTPVFQGRPSVATMVNFLIIAFVGFLFNFSNPSKKTFSVIGFIVGNIGLIGMIGYLIRTPVLYYEIPGISNAIAIHTTILFTFLGAALFLIGQEKSEISENKE